jgi:chemotaxis protein MotB
MTMVDKIIFPSGSVEISKEGKKVLDKVVSILKDVKDKRIQVEGHTDNVQIVSDLKKRFPTNWELSTARATEVVRYLQETGGINPASFLRRAMVNTSPWLRTIPMRESTRIAVLRLSCCRR